MCTNGGKGLLVGKPFLGVENGPGAVGSDRERGCMCCEMDKAFEEVMSAVRFHTRETLTSGSVL